MNEHYSEEQAFSVRTLDIGTFDFGCGKENDCKQHNAKYNLRMAPGLTNSIVVKPRAY